MGLAVFCIYAVDFAVNGGEFEPFLFFSTGFLGVEGEGGMEEGCGADDEDSASDGEEFDC